jgi:signal peptidase II
MKVFLLKAWALGLVILLLDQWTKWLVVTHLELGEQREWVEGFFRLVYWGNTGAAWSLFRGNNYLLAGVALIALILLHGVSRQFDAHRLRGQFALGLMFGGIVGNLLDRFQHGHVVDFIYFFTYRHGGGELGFPAFNLADSAICVGVLTLFLISLQKEAKANKTDLMNS